MIWTSKVHYVDKETGELITATHVENSTYVITNKRIIRRKISETYGIKHITNICEKNRQQKLF